jgi:hypothetical protein
VSNVRYATHPRFPHYRVGSDGSVWTRKVQGSTNGRIGPWRKLRLSQTTGGYPTVVFSVNGRITTCLVHRLVLELFVGLCPLGWEACHNDGVRTNNSVTNLRWDTPASNQADRVQHGTSILTYNKLTLDKARLIKSLRSKGLTILRIAEQVKTSTVTVSSVLSGKTWRGA